MHADGRALTEHVGESICPAAFGRAPPVQPRLGVVARGRAEPLGIEHRVERDAFGPIDLVFAEGCDAGETIEIAQAPQQGMRTLYSGSVDDNRAAPRHHRAAAATRRQRPPAIRRKARRDRSESATRSPSRVPGSCARTRCAPPSRGAPSATRSRGGADVGRNRTATGPVQGSAGRNATAGSTAPTRPSRNHLCR